MSFEAPIPPYNASDPHATFLSSSVFDFLLIEVVPLAYRTAASVSRPVIPARTSIAQATSTSTGTATTDSHTRKASSAGATLGKTGLGAATATTATTATTASPASTTAPAAPGTATEDDTQRDIVSKRLEALGYRVGQGIVERFSRDRPRFADALDVIKFLCKDLWTLLFRKQIDNLKTNHRGVYVLTDNAFRPFSRMSMKTSAEALERAQPFLWFPCGVIRGALASLGIQAVVQAESMELPSAVFQIKTVAATKG